MVDNKKGWFKRKSEPTVENRSLLIPDITTNPATWADFNDAYNGRVSIPQALAIPAMAAAWRITATAVSQLDMIVERNGQVIDSPLVARPDANRTQSSFWKRTTTNLFTTGNAFWRLYRNSDGAVVNMEVMANSRTEVKWNSNGEKFYAYKMPNGKMQTLTNNTPTKNGQVEHLRLGEFEEWELGVGPIQLNNAALYSICEQRFYIDRFIAESRRPSGIYSFDADMDPDELAQAKKQIVTNRATGEPDVLPKGVKYQSVMITPEAAQLSELNKSAVLEVVRITGIPAYKLAATIEGNSMTYANVSQADLAWVRDALDLYLTAIEDAMSNVLPRGQEASFDVDNWLRAVDAITPNQTGGSAPEAPVEE